MSNEPVALSSTRRIALLAPFALSSLAAACTSSWEGEAESPRPAWEDDSPPGASTVAAPPPPAPVQAQTGTIQSSEDVEDTDPTAVATFEPVLQPYGAWVDDPVYGYVWVPDPAEVGPGFQPYVTSGHWAYTDEGYYWASDYSWGWATFHYGRWVWVDGRGWVWIPGARYSPAWVEWRYGDGYIGWGPAYPHYCWHGYSAVWITVGPTPYVFAPSQSFFDPHPSHVIVTPSAAPGLVASTHPYAPKPVVGQKPFVGPDPKQAGIPASHIPAASIQPQNKNVAWNPAPGSKIGANKVAGPVPGPATKPMGMAPGGSKSLGTSPSYGYDPPAATAPKWNGPTATAKPWSGSPSYKPPTPSGGGAPTYKPPAYSSPSYGTPSYGTPSYGTPSYKPPTYGGSPAPKPYSPPSYGYGGSPAPKPYSPPTYSAPKSYSPPPTYSPAPKSYSPPPSFSHPSAPSAPVSKPSSKPSYSAPHVGKHK